MAGATRCTLAVLALLLLASTPYAIAQESSEFDFILQDQDTSENGWYVEGDMVSMVPMFVNNAVETSIENDPSCGVSLQIIDDEQNMLFDGADSCRGQSQTIDLSPDETFAFTALEWDLRLDDGTFAESGTYTIQAFHSATGATASNDIFIQTSADVSPEMELLLDFTSRASPLLYGEEIVLGVVLHNPTSQAFTLPVREECYIELSMNGISSLAMPCFGSMNTLESHEHVLLGHVLFNDASLLQGLNTVQASLPSQALLVSESFTLQDATAVDASIQSMTAVRIVPSSTQDQVYSESEIFSSVVHIDNIGSEPLDLRFTDSCRAEVWIVNGFGDVVFDSRLLKNCNALELDYSIEGNGQLQFTLPDWTFTDLQGCRVPAGTYSVIAEIPEYHLATQYTIEYQHTSPNNCNPSPEFEIYPELTPTDAGFDLDLTLETPSSNVDLQWIDACSIRITIIDLATIEEVSNQALMCDSLEGRHFVLPYGEDVEPLVLNAGEVGMYDEMLQPLDDGNYQLVLTFNSFQPVRMGFALTWPVAEEGTSIEQTVEAVVEEDPRLISGSWSGLQTELGTCWMLDSTEEGQVLLASALLGSWVPNQGWSGIYEVVDAPAHPACAMYQAPSVQIRTLEVEYPIQTTEDVAETSVIAEDDPAAEEQPVPVVPSVIIVVASGSILSMLFAVLLSNESLRIPSTAAGLWFLGLIGRTHETNDGRYQRGRLMGYLTANPGCHFRALMAALDMSNGQITHHLRILESEEVIWRRKDGRLVRYYPLTNSLNPGMSEDDLPVPPLSPDPNSLQGKILTLLDHDGPLGEFPTQAELAVRLEKSQQLVSHHLRTLQKFGLVEKRKMGVKNRYKLTREAIFLLETNTDFTRED